MQGFPSYILIRSQTDRRGAAADAQRKRENDSVSGSTDRSAAPEPIEHRTPTAATVKQLYATAFRCAKPDCRRPLYRMNDETGETVLNSRVAHIHARSEGGPRWDPDMSEADNRRSDNLLLLCLEHASEVDETPEHFPAETLRQWKAAQLAEYAEIHTSWPLTDAQAAEVSAVSFDAHAVGIATVAASAVADAARAVGMLIETGRNRRLVVRQVVDEWLAMRARVSRSVPVWDSNGNRLEVEPAYVDTRPHEQALDRVLAESSTALEPLRAVLFAELRAVSATNVALTPWCQWLERAASALVDAAGRWQGRPPEPDDRLWPGAIAEAEGAWSALNAASRGDQSTKPPAPDVVSEPSETDEDRLVREHYELLDAARPWARVTQRPYDSKMFDRLIDAAELAVQLPAVLSLLTVGLEATTGLAANVARNADDATFRGLIARARDLQPLAVAVSLLTDLMRIADSSSRAELQSESAAEAEKRLRAETWSTSRVWGDNRFHARTLLNSTASFTSDQEVRQMLAGALLADPRILDGMLAGVAQWIETLPFNTSAAQASALSDRIESLPIWFPTDQVVTEIRARFPDLTPASVADDPVSGDPDHTKRLASHVLHIASGS